MPETPIRYTLAVGRRKTATARVKLTPAAETSIVINGLPGEEYFKTKERRSIPLDPLGLEEVTGTFAIEAKVNGGGVNAQAEAIRMGVARAVTLTDANLRTPLKVAGFLKRDPRAVERKKPGLRKARKSPQWSKR
ncbi:MAG: 30S ribosomal protein S9 [Patescibacteria group bacterium]